MGTWFSFPIITRPTMNTAIITGASKGIGKAIAQELASRGYNLILVARTEDLLRKISIDIADKYKVKVNYLVLDLTQLQSIDKIVTKIKEKNLSVNVLVNNAGYAHWGNFIDLDLAEQEKMMFVNMNLLVQLTHRLMPFLQANKKSYILNVSSSSAYQAVPTLAIYCASKSFVLQFSRAIRHELKAKGVYVSCLSPGPTDTNFMDAAGMTTPEMKKRAAKFNMTATRVAQIAVRGMLNNKAEIIPGFLNLLQAKLVNFVPKILTENIAAGLYK